MKHRQNKYKYIKNKLTNKKYSRNLKRYFTDIAVTLTDNFNRQNQKLLKMMVRGILKAFACICRVTSSGCRLRTLKKNFPCPLLHGLVTSHNLRKYPKSLTQKTNQKHDRQSFNKIPAEKWIVLGL